MGVNDLLMVAGEASGDLHGARLLEELHHSSPQIAAFGLGGEELQQAGLDPVAHSSEISVVGITEAFGVLKRAREIFSLLLREVDRRNPFAAVLIDSPDFNLRLAKKLKKRGVHVIYYISPQVWAWRRGRIQSIARWVDEMLVILPFEVEFYRQHGVEAIDVGHPLVDEVPSLPHIWDQEGSARGPFQVALLPGSRSSEINAILRTLLRAAELLSRELPVRPMLIKAPTVRSEQISQVLSEFDLDVKVVEKRRFECIAASHLALCASGTATLEVGLLGTPMIVVYRVGAGSAFIGRLVIRLSHVSLVNLVLGREAVPELLQDDATPEAIASLAAALLGDPKEIRMMRAALRELRGKLGESGASRRAAEQILGCLEEERCGVKGSAS
jgi:lipid-A-disaccharide synthase